MPLVWCSISGHGFGHAAQTVPILNALGQRVAGLRVVLRTVVPAHFFEGRLQIPWELSVQEQDIGCVQRGPLHIDVSATWTEHARFHRDWESRVDDERRAIGMKRPDLVLSNISYLAIEAAARAGVPSAAVSSLSWDQILTPLAEPEHAPQRALLAQMIAAYGHAFLMIRLAPGILLKAFREVRDVHSVVDPAMSRLTTVRELLQAGPDEHTVLVAFGGVPLSALPLNELEKMTGFRFVVDMSVPDAYVRCRSVTGLGLSVRELLASVDIIVSKPGYSTVVEAVALRKALVYVRRYNFGDESVLVDYLHLHGRAAELSLKDFQTGHWRSALEQVLASPPPVHVPPSTGAAEAADILSAYL